MIRIRLPQSLRIRMMAFTGSMFLVLALVIVVSISIFISSSEQQAWRARQREAVHNAAIEVANYLERNEYTLHGLDTYGFDEIKTNPEIFRTLFEDSPAFLEIVFLDKYGRVIQDIYKKQPILANQFTILQSEWFQVANSGQKYYTGVQISPQGDSYLIFAMPSQHGGVVAAQIKMDALWQTVAEIHFGKEGNVYAVNQQGQVIAHSNEQIVLSNRNIRSTEQFDAILQAPDYEWYGNAVNFEDENVVIYSTLIQETNWIIISELPLKEAFATSRQALVFLPSGILFLTTLTTLFFRNMLNHLFIQPINSLRDGAYKIGQGNLSHRIDIARMDELGEVMVVFNRMAIELEKQHSRMQEQNKKIAVTNQQLQIELIERKKAQAALKKLNQELELRVDERTSDLKRVNNMLTSEIAEHQRAEEQLVEAENKFRTLVEKIPAAVFIWELGENGACRYISPQIEKMLGFSVEQWLTDPQMWKRQLHPDDFEYALADDTKALETGQAEPAEYRLIARDGRAVWVRDDAVVLPHEPGQPRLNFGVLSDITEQKQNEERIMTSLQEKEVLLKEIHHRVKNNLQIISSLLNLQTNQVKDTGSLRALRDSQARVRSMALIHEKLYQSQTLAQIDFGEYVRSLATDLFRSYQRSLGEIKLKVEADEIILDLDYAVPCGLILNELMTNALKYAFPHGRKGTLWVELSTNTDQMLSLKVADDGVGLPVGIDIFNTGSLGLQLVRNLVVQVDGKLDVDRSIGTAFKVLFKY